jgi:hypothetical protein
MKRLAIPAFLLFAALGAQADAGPLPKAKSLVERHKSSNFTHLVRADQALPKADPLVERHESSNFTHYVRADQALPKADALVERHEASNFTHYVRTE